MSAASLLSKGAMKLFHGAKKNFDSFDSEFASETAFGKGFSFTPEQDIAEGYANITPAKLRKLYGKEYVEEAIERKKGGTPILYEVEADVKDSEILVTRKNFNEQDKEVQEKLKKLIDAEGLNLEELDLNKPKFWRQILNLTNKDADKLFTKYGIKAALKDARDSKLKQVGGKVEYTVYDPKAIKIKNKKVLERAKKNRGSEMKVPKVKYAVGSVAQAAAEGADTLLSEARKDVVAQRSPEPGVGKDDTALAETLAKVDGPGKTEAAPEGGQDNLIATTKLVNSFSFQGGNKKMDKQFIMESLSSVADTPIVENKQSIAEFITDLHRVQVEEESKPLLSPKDFQKLNSFAADASDEGRLEKKEGGEVSDVDKYISLYKSMEQSMDKAKDDASKERIYKRFAEVENSFDGNVISNALQKMDAEEEGRVGKFFGGLLKAGKQVLNQSGGGEPTGILGALLGGSGGAEGTTTVPQGQDEAASISALEGPDPISAANNAPIANFAEGGRISVSEYVKARDKALKDIDNAESIAAREKISEDFSKVSKEFMEQESLGNSIDRERAEKAEALKKKNMGGSLLADDKPVDTYDNIPEGEKEAVEASQLPDEEMEDEYAGFVLGEALSTEDQEYLMGALEGDERLGGIFDKVMDIAGEFAGDGAVKGPGTGTSDSIPARLSDGEFVFTRKATDQLGTEKLQTMMDEAERAYDGGLMKKYMGGSILGGMDEVEDNDKKVYDQMLTSNAMPSVR